MKLYAVGTSSANPDDWGIWDEVGIVIAESLEQARQIGNSGEAVEIPMDKAMLVMRAPEPDWGEDT